MTDLGDAHSLRPLGQNDRAKSEMALMLELLQCVAQLFPGGIEPIRFDRGCDV